MTVEKTLLATWSQTINLLATDLLMTWAGNTNLLATIRQSLLATDFYLATERDLL